MLTRQFTEEQAMFREAYRRFLAEEVVPHMERFRSRALSIGGLQEGWRARLSDGVAGGALRRHG
ncbi:MAG: hypothetical protein CM15mP84_06290 [Cellvibrionales bacterium]|nr:MAG: hypothetical protein CM15mP84_06290 [Cellvibrionales bacterium]